jgi:hypothetical protein
MLELLIVACLGGEECREFPHLYDPYQVSLMTCVASGQIEVARWVADHPEWTVRRWSCGYHDPRTAASEI